MSQAPFTMERPFRSRFLPFQGPLKLPLHGEPLPLLETTPFTVERPFRSCLSHFQDGFANKGLWTCHMSQAACDM